MTIALEKTVFEMDISVSDIHTWTSLREKLPSLFGSELQKQLADHVLQHGLIDPLEGHVRPENVRIDSQNYRESIAAVGTNSRQRALLLVLNDILGIDWNDAEIYASEAVSPLARRLAKSAKHFTGSEYLPTEEDKRKHPDIQHQDVMAFDFPDSFYDVYISSDVFEHIPDIPKALKEAQRILKPGGVLLGTVPFASGRMETLIRSKLTAEGIVHIESPQYHGNPTRPEEGSLVFQIPGWDFMDSCREAGFVNCHLRLILSRRHGIFGKDTAFIIAFVATAS